jgi:ribonucleoside-diphosphate reductase beta chain
MDSVPFRLYQKAKQLMWDPEDIDFSKDAEDWAAMPRRYQASFASSCRGFMIGEEGVTLDIGPLLVAMADEGRTEEVMYLTTFAFEEGKHVEFFRRWFDAVGVDAEMMLDLAVEGAQNRGFKPPDPERNQGMFESQLPRIMRRAMLERSPETILDASLTYNQFIEACLAITGYKRFARMFELADALPGLQEGLRMVRADEGRHITYGTYLCRRILTANPELIDFARDRMYQLYDEYIADVSGDAEGERRSDDDYDDLLRRQLEGRVQILEKAAQVAAADAETAEVHDTVTQDLAALA